MLTLRRGPRPHPELRRGRQRRLRPVPRLGRRLPPSNRYKPFYPKYRFSQTVRYCDSHHNTGGFSGTNSHGTQITKNNFYDNALGYTTDVFTAPGHPGFPQHGNIVRDNNFYDNNFNPFPPARDVDPFIPAPVGTGLWLAGGNHNVIRDNHFYDNWRRGAMLFAVPDATRLRPASAGQLDAGARLHPARAVDVVSATGSTDNTMGVEPRRRGQAQRHRLLVGLLPAATRGNCWWANTAAPGKKRDQPRRPSCPAAWAAPRPITSIGTGDVLNESELVACFAGFTFGPLSRRQRPAVLLDDDASPAGRQAQALAARTTGAAGGLGGDLRHRARHAAVRAVPATLAGSRHKAVVTRSRRLPTRSSAQGGVVQGPAWAPSPAAGGGAPTTTTSSGMVHRIRDFATGKINGRRRRSGTAPACRTRGRELFEDRCSTFQAGPFALYKLYGAAAPFAALTN